jgi:transposase-like protein
MKRLTEEKLREVLRVVAEEGSCAKAGNVLGATRNTVEHWVRLAKERQVFLTPKRDPLESALIEIRKLKQELNLLHRHNENAEAVRKEIYGLSNEPVNPPKWVIDANRVGRKARAGIPFCHWSDWHYGENVSISGTAYANEFNRDIAGKRVHSLVENSIRLAKGFAFQGNTSAPSGIVIALNGDLISGDIHEELRETNEAPPFVCVNEVLGLLIWAIDTMAENFGRVFVPCTVGNHGRTTHKPRAKNRVFLSYEWNLYMMLQRHYAGNPKVVVTVSDHTDILYKVAGHRILQTHGDALGVKGGDGIIGALGPIARGAIKLRNSEFKLGRDFDYLIMGHWHQDLWIGRTIVNGALKGYDEYARLVLRAEPSRPSQQLWFMHPEHGMTARMPVFVDSTEVNVDKSVIWAEVGT